MRKGSHIMVLATFALGGCGLLVDDPKNVPLRGRWQREVKMGTIVVNDLWVDRDKVPFDLPKDSVETKGCVEPRIQSVDEVNEGLLDSKATRNCVFAPLARNGTTVTSDAVCATAKEYGGTIGGTMDLEAHEAPAVVDGRVGAALFYRTSDGASQRVRLGVTFRWTRLGDCGS